MMIWRRIRGYFDRVIFGLVLAVLSTLFLKDTSVGLFLALVGTSLSGFLGTGFALSATALGPVLNTATINLLIVRIPFLWGWLAVDTLHLLLCLPYVDKFFRWIQGWIGILTVGLGYFFVEFIKVIPFVVKIVLFLVFGWGALQLA